MFAPDGPVGKAGGPGLVKKTGSATHTQQVSNEVSFNVPTLVSTFKLLL